MEKPKKGSVIAIVVIIVVSGVGFVLANLGGKTEGFFSSTRDSFASDVSYRDDGRTIPIGTSIQYELSNRKVDAYDIKTDPSGRLPIAYESNIEKGKAFLEIRQGDTVVHRFQFEGSDKFDVDLSPNTSYSLKIVIDVGKGSINLRWMELA